MLARTPIALIGVILLAACTSSMLAARVDRNLGVGSYAPLPADSVRLVEVRYGPGWQEAMDSAVGGPYEALASIDTRGVGKSAAADAVAALRRRVGESGGNVAALLYVRPEAPPYTVASGYALRLRPPMADAAERCARLVAPDSAGERVVACREAARRAPSDPRPVRDLALASLALALRGQATRAPGLAIQGAWGDAALAARRAARIDPTFGGPAPYLPGAVALFDGDSLRAYKAIALVLLGGPGVLSPSEGALQAYREVVRLAPDSTAGYTRAVDILLAQKRPDEALRVAAALARRRPERVEGWARAAVAANAMGDHTRSMRLWARVLTIDPHYFRASFVPAYGWSEHRGSEQRVGKQPAATTDDLP